MEEEEVQRGTRDAGFPQRNKSEFQIQEIHTAWSNMSRYFQKTIKFGTLICKSSRKHFFFSSSSFNLGAGGEGNNKAPLQSHQLS